MIKKRSSGMFAVILAASLLLTACSARETSAPESAAGAASAASSASADKTEAAESASAEDAKEKAQHAADLIDAIYVQQRTENTDEQCSEAKAAWDALTDEEKAMVSGEYADPDYFGRDTGDAAQDDPLNADGIGERELLAVSFGTSFNQSRAEDIGGIEKALQKAYPDWSVRRAFTSQIIINHVQARDGERIDNVDQALQRAADNGVRELVVQPTHLMHGAEYDELKETLDRYQERFEGGVVLSEPLLGAVGSDASAVNDDKKSVAEAVTAEAVRTAGYDSLTAAAKDGTAFVFLGHGTSHTANVTYDQMQTQMQELGYDNVFIGTVEGKPEDTECDAVIRKASGAGYHRIILRPLMVVAGDHANNDMAGQDEDSWKSRFEASGKFDEVDAQIAGLGEIPDIQSIYVEHAGSAVRQLAPHSDAAAAGTSVLPDGTYTVNFVTDSSMFRVNDAMKGKGTLTVLKGGMTVHVSLVSKKIVKLYMGTAKEAEKAQDGFLEPTTDTVVYDDGMTEEVYGFDIPVEQLDQDFALAILGTKGKWYDHMVSVTDPAASGE